MSRSLKKGPYIDENLIAKVSALKEGDSTILKLGLVIVQLAQKW